MNKKSKMTAQEYRNMKANDPYKPVILSQPKKSYKTTSAKAK